MGGLSDGNFAPLQKPGRSVYLEVPGSYDQAITVATRSFIWYVLYGIENMVSGICLEVQGS